MHSLFRIDEPLPLPPGESPFHIRGLYYDRLVSNMRRRMGKTDAVLGVFEDPGLREFVQQKFAWTGWYDVMPAVPICAAFTRWSGMEFESGVREQTRLGAIEVIPSALRFALRVPGPAAMASQTAHVVAMTMDFVELDIERSTAGHSSGWHRGVPRYVAPHIANTVLGFFQAMLELRGGKDVRARYLDVVPDGERHGFPTVAIRYEFDWTAK